MNNYIIRDIFEYIYMYKCIHKILRKYDHDFLYDCVYALNLNNVKLTRDDINDIKRCRNLRRLKYRYDNDVKASHNFIKTFKTLTHLSITYCNDVIDFETFGSKNSLIELNCSHNLSTKNINVLSNLISLECNWNNNLDVGELKKLKYLHCNFCTKIFNVGKLIQLEELECNNTAIGDISNLENLIVLRCKYSGYKDVRKMINLKILNTDEYYAMYRHHDACVTKITGLNECKNLEVICGINSDNLRICNDCNFDKVRALVLHHCDIINSCTNIKRNIGYLECSCCKNFKIDNMDKLESLYACDCTIDDIENNNNVSQISIERSVLTKVNNLCNLSIMTCRKCLNLETISNVPKLRELYVSECDNFENLENAYNIEKIEYFGTNVKKICNLPKLEKIRLVDCQSLKYMINLPSLHEVNITFCPSLIYIKNIPRDCIIKCNDECHKNVKIIYDDCDDLNDTLL